MSQIYSSSSGSYSNYLAQRQNDEVAKAINLQTAMNISAAAHMETGIRHEMRQMSTGIQTSINKNTYAVVASANMLQSTFQNGFDSINNTLDLGFAGVSMEIGCMSASMSAGLSMLSEKMEKWGTEICDKLDKIHDIVNNPLLTASRELYRRAVTNTSKKFYEEALEDIKGAIENNKTDYISWGLMGKLYLFGMSEFSDVVDVQKSLEAFTNACKYITPDIEESEDAKKLASEYYFYLGYADYVLANESSLAGNLNEKTSYLKSSIKANEKSYSFSNDMLEALYNKARAYCLLDQTSDALDCLEIILKKDAIYAIKVLGDDDFNKIEMEIVDLITELRDELFQSYSTKITTLLNDYYYFNTEYAQETKKILEVNNLDSTAAYLEVFLASNAVEKIYRDIVNKKTPLDLEAATLIFGSEQCGVCNQFFSKIYNEILLPTHFDREPAITNWHFSRTDESEFKNEYGLCEISNPNEYQINDETVAGYRFKSYEYGDGEIKLEYSDLEDVDDLQTIIKDGEDIKVWTIGEKETFYIDEDTIFEYELLEKNHSFLLQGEICENHPSKARLSVKQRSIVEKGKVKLQKEKGEKLRKDEERIEEVKEIRNAQEAAIEYKVSKNNKTVYIIGILLLVPLVILGSKIFHKGGGFIMACLDIAFISYFVAKSILGSIGADWKGQQSFLAGWGLYQRKNPVLLISSLLFFCSVGIKIGSFLTHGFLGFLAGLVVYIVLLVVLNICSKDYQ